MEGTSSRARGQPFDEIVSQARHVVVELAAAVCVALEEVV